ncbi:MAG TPA: hypothetical protein VKV39_01335 [Candidatus Sulfotelmatobacter sp.]|nr:hypothetical protein [Candidatus Sulfotelmatobacter sp.]
MAALANGSSEGNDWRNLYVTALFENDRDKIPLLIERAERAIVQRARELFGAEGDHIEEEEALDDALYALRALKTCLATHSRCAEAA